MTASKLQSNTRNNSKLHRLQLTHVITSLPEVTSPKKINKQTKQLSTLRLIRTHVIYAAYKCYLTGTASCTILELAQTQSLLFVVRVSVPPGLVAQFHKIGDSRHNPYIIR